MSLRVGVIWPAFGSGAHAAASPSSFARLVPCWLEDLAMRHYSPATRVTWSAGMGIFAAWCEERGIKAADQVTRPIVEAYQRQVFRLRTGYARATRQRKEAAKDEDIRPLSVKTQRQRLTAVERFYSWAVKRGHVPANPASDLEHPRDARVLPPYLTRDEVEQVVTRCAATPAGLRDRAFVELLYGTGLRRSEACALTLEDLDAERGMVHVRKGKGGHERYAPIGTRALGWLDHYVREVRAVWCQDPAQRLLFIEPDGTPSPTGRMGDRVHRLITAAGISKRGSCHLFRHAFATVLIEAGCEVRTIAAMLGHRDIDTTMVYTHVGINRLITAYRQFHPDELEASRASAPVAAGR